MKISQRLNLLVIIFQFTGHRYTQIHVISELIYDMIWYIWPSLEIITHYNAVTIMSYRYQLMWTRIAPRCVKSFLIIYECNMRRVYQSYRQTYKVYSTSYISFGICIDKSWYVSKPWIIDELINSIMSIHNIFIPTPSWTWYYLDWSVPK